MGHKEFVKNYNAIIESHAKDPIPEEEECINDAFNSDTPINTLREVGAAAGANTEGEALGYRVGVANGVMLCNKFRDAATPLIVEFIAEELRHMMQRPGFEPEMILAYIELNARLLDFLSSIGLVSNPYESGFSMTGGARAAAE